MPSARKAAAPGLRAVVAWQVLRFASKLAFAAALAVLAGAMIEFGAFSTAALCAAFVALVVSAAAGILGDRSQAAAEAEVVEAIHSDIRGQT